MKSLDLLRQAASDPRLALMLPLGFSSGLPFLLIFSTQSAWLSGAGVPPREIGLMSWCLLAFSFKFVWAPIIDRYDPPALAGWLGRRRAWMLIAQFGIAAGLVGLAFADPAHSLLWSVVCGSLTGFAAATQDITIDAWRIDAAPAERQGLMVGVYSAGYRVALICAGAGALYLSDFAGWRTTYLLMAILTVVGMAGCLAAPRIDRVAVGPAPDLSRSFTEPLADLVTRYGATIAPILVLVALYRMPDFLSGVMAIPLYKNLGFTNSDIATATKLYGVWVSIAGTLAGGWCVARVGLMPTLLAGGAAAAASHLTFVWLNGYPKHFEALIVAVSCDNFATGIAGAALIAFMSSLVAPKYAATQYALFSSLYALPGKLVGGASGFFVEDWGYPRFFASTSMIGIPVALLCLLVWRLQAAKTAAPSPRPAQ
jgi:PAT family beta-lactamase induction signal transducer AmpG